MQRVAIHGPESWGEPVKKDICQPEPQVTAGADDVIGTTRLYRQLFLYAERPETDRGSVRLGHCMLYRGSVISEVV